MVYGKNTRLNNRYRLHKTDKSAYSKKKKKKLPNVHLIFKVDY